MSLLDKTKTSKTITLSFKVSMQDVEDLDKNKPVVVTIKGDDFIIKRKSK
jgi:hypothetical protein